LSSDAGLTASGIELFESLRRVGGVLAADGGKVKDVELAALGNAAGAKSRVDLGQSDRSACGEGEDGGGELHVECNLWVG